MNTRATDFSNSQRAMEEAQFELTDGEAIIEEDAVALREIGQHIRQQQFMSNAEIISATPVLTMDVQAIDVKDLLETGATGRELRNTLAGMAMMLNRLIFENRYLSRELQSLKAGGAIGNGGRLETLNFKKTNITRQYYFNGSQDEEGNEIPKCVVNEHVELFDQNCSRRNESVVSTLRRFVKYLLENIIPKHLHTRYTVRERGGYDHLTELPAHLTAIIKEVCLEAVNLDDARTPEDRELREELSENVFRYMKFSLQELRRTPRKAKMPVERKVRGK